MEFILKYKLVFILLAAAVLAVMLCVIMKHRKKRKDELEMKRLHRRNEALADALSNPMAKGERTGKANGPLEINWDEKTVNGTDKTAEGMMLELTELSAYSRKKYVFKSDRPVTIGSGENNEMVIFKDGVAERHCVITVTGEKPYVYVEHGERAVLRRGRNTAVISETGLFLRNGDQIEMGSAVVQFRVFKS